jgi:flagellar L-ring protein precursor FlgH
MNDPKINKISIFKIITGAIITAILLSIPLLCQQTNQKKFDNIRQRSLVSDYKAIGIGDAVLVLIIEETEAGNSAGTSESRNSNLSVGAGAGLNASSVSADANIGTGNSFKGSGANTRKETIRSKLSAKVVDEDDRGNFIIEGTRRTKVDGEDQTIILKGIIRAADIRSDNSIYSYSIMDLELYVEGEGNASKMQKPGLFTKFFRLLF